MYKRFRCRIPMNIQVFAEPGNGGAGDAGTGGNQGQSQPQKDQPPVIDYDKIQQMLNGTLAAKEDTALKAYFKQQGMSEDDMKQAITAFKQQKAANQPDVGAMQTELDQTKAALLQEQLQSAGTMVAVSLGIEPKSIPYVLKMADMSKAAGQDGKINEEEVKNALNKVLEDVPALKPQVQQASGFRFGVSGQGQQETANENALKKAFGL